MIRKLVASLALSRNPKVVDMSTRKAVPKAPWIESSRLIFVLVTDMTQFNKKTVRESTMTF